MRLISKTIIYYLLISIPLLLLAGYFSYYQIDNALSDETDETLLKESNQSERLIVDAPLGNSIYLSYDSLSFIQPVKNIQYHHSYSDTSIFDNAEKEFVNYRVLKNTIKKNTDYYLVVVLKSTLDKEDLKESLFLAFALIICFLTAAFFVVNLILSKALWKPFYKTLFKLTSYDVKKQQNENFESAEIFEFNQLNSALNEMVKKLQVDFLQQKEFTENASHEMQTPLAIIKTSVSTLMQSDRLNVLEINELEVIENTVKKLSLLNKTLLLFTKIENQQFSKSQIVNINEVIKSSLQQYSDFIKIKNIRVSLNLGSDLPISMNPMLADILVSNLLKNAIRHNFEGGEIIISSHENKISFMNSGETLSIHPDEMFIRFKKNDGSNESLGLGLSLVKTILEFYNYKISYSSINSSHQFSIDFQL
jgi:signal transduction histidine kinase